MAHVLHIRRIDLYLNFEKLISGEEINRFKTLLKRRLRHEPLQHLIGQTEFMSLPFHVNSETLIPRPETELLVQTVVDICQNRFAGNEPISILDIGTGSGNIAISLAKFIPHSRIFALEISAEALKIARENAILNQVNEQITFLHHDIALFQPERQFEVIVSNPPYIRQDEWLTLPPEVQHYEPPIALLGGADGLKLYQIICDRMKDYLVLNGFFIFEIGCEQARAVSQILQSIQFMQIEKFCDLNGHDRVIMATRM